MNEKKIIVITMAAILVITAAILTLMG